METNSLVYKYLNLILHTINFSCSRDIVNKLNVFIANYKVTPNIGYPELNETVQEATSIHRIKLLTE